jgi:hypothetical protein
MGGPIDLPILCQRATDCLAQAAVGMADGYVWVSTLAGEAWLGG